MKKYLLGILFCVSIPLVSPPGIDAQSASGIWISPAELALLPISSPAWDSVFSRANSICTTPNLADQDDSANICILAKALVFARIGGGGYRSDVVAALRSIADSGAYSGRALALGRELGDYAISADLISLSTYDPALDQQFRAKIRELLTTFTTSGPSSLIECHEKRPNNWGLHCGGSRAAVAAYLGDTAQLAQVAQVFKGWLGDRSSYAGFAYGDLSWQCDPSQPVGINAAGCMKNGHSIDGVLADDQRRGGSFTWPPPKVNYVYESLQGALLQATILERAGYDVFNWEDQALLRAYRWLHEQADFPAAGDDTWQPHVANYFYQAGFPAPVPSAPGKNLGWTDWVFGALAPPESNTAPISQNEAVTTDEDTAATVLLSGADAEQCDLQFTPVSGPSHGSLGVITDANCTAGSPNMDTATIPYTPGANFNGSDSFTYRVGDGTLTISATVSIAVNPTNDAPVAKGTSASTNSGTPVAVTLSATDVDDCAQPVSFSVFAAPASGSLSAMTGVTCVSGSHMAQVTYTAFQGFTGSDSFTYRANDGFADSNIATATVTVRDPLGVSGIQPNVVSQKDGTLDFLITGTGFAPGATVAFENGGGAAPRVNSVTWNSATQLKASLEIRLSGPRDRVWDVRVTNPDGSVGIGLALLRITP